MVSSVIYPDNTGGNRKATYGYGSANGVGDKLSRVGSLAFGGGTVVDYTYYGLGTAVKTDYSAAGINWDLITGSGSDPYAGLDRFGRIVRNLWKVTSGGAALDEIKYGYDRASNRIWRENMVAKAQTTPQYFDELYGYDGAYRLTQTQRGQLAGNPPSSVTNKRFAQAWPTLDPLGNWLSFNEDSNGDGTNDLTQTRAANAVNEITSLSTSPTAWTQPGYDAAGNMTSLPRPSAPTSGYLATYDAWHRLVKLRTDVTTPVTVAEYAYDGLTRRTVKKTHASGTLSETRHFYYSAGWRLLEERIDAGTTYGAQYVWGLRYIDDCVLRDRPSGSERLYVLQDANWNVDALYSSGIVERYAYAPYGAPTVLNADFTVKSGGTGYAWNVLYAGYKWDAESGLFQVRFRYLHPMLGNWVTRDPIGYGSDTNLYWNVYGNPIVYVDPFGLRPCLCGCEGLVDVKDAVNDHFNKLIGRTLAAVAMQNGNFEARQEALFDALVKGTVLETNAELSLLANLRGVQMNNCSTVFDQSATSILIQCGQDKICIGLDKIGHFFQLGYAYQEIRSKLMKKYRLTEADAIAAAEAWGSWTEGIDVPNRTANTTSFIKTPPLQGGKGVDPFNNPADPFRDFRFSDTRLNRIGAWGSLADQQLGLVFDPTGVSSPADLAANSTGFKFWSDFAKAGFKDTFKFDICAYISTDWDQSVKKNTNKRLPQRPKN